MWLVVALCAQCINGSAAVFDKLILRKSYPNPVKYTFWLAMTGLSALVLVPFGFYTPDTITLIFSFVAGIAFVIAMLFYFYGLSYGQASNVVILMAAVTPITTYMWGKIILDTNLGSYQTIAFVLLCLGGLILFLTENKKVRFSVLAYILLAAFLMSLSNTVSKLVFNDTNFATGFIWIKMGGAFTAFGFLFFSQVRKSIVEVTAEKVVRSRLGYLGNRAFAGLGSALLQYAILLGIPAMVDATASVQFIVVLIGSVFLLKEHFKGWILFGKIAAVIITATGVIFLAFSGLASSLKYDENRRIEWGTTFSQDFSESLGLDWKENYEALLSDLGVKKIRLIAYWDLMQKEPGEINFEDLDYQMDLALGYGAEVVLAMGEKAPRWPECHTPEWAKELSQEEFNKALLSFMGAVVDRYKNNGALLYWQVENEPFLSFGECSMISGRQLDSEISFVKGKDPFHEILVTDSGEVGPWYYAIKRGDVFGTTMYRRVHNKFLGDIDYHLPPVFFRIKENVVRKLAGVSDKKMIVIELGAEPWLQRGIAESPLEEQFKAFDLDFFKDSVRYAKETGFDNYYFWGAEWWYWLRVEKNHPEFWDYARNVIQSVN